MGILGGLSFIQGLAGGFANETLRQHDIERQQAEEDRKSIIGMYQQLLADPNTNPAAYPHIVGGILDATGAHSNKEIENVKGHFRGLVNQQFPTDDPILQNQGYAPPDTSASNLDSAPSTYNVTPQASPSQIPPPPSVSPQSAPAAAGGAGNYLPMPDGQVSASPTTINDMGAPLLNKLRQGSLFMSPQQQTAIAARRAGALANATVDPKIRLEQAKFDARAKNQRDKAAIDQQNRLLVHSADAAARARLPLNMEISNRMAANPDLSLADATKEAGEFLRGLSENKGDLGAARVDKIDADTEKSEAQTAVQRKQLSVMDSLIQHRQNADRIAQMNAETNRGRLAVMQSNSVTQTQKAQFASQSKVPQDTINDAMNERAGLMRQLSDSSITKDPKQIADINGKIEALDAKITSANQFIQDNANKLTGAASGGTSQGSSVYTMGDINAMADKYNYQGATRDAFIKQASDNFLGKSKVSSHAPTQGQYAGKTFPVENLPAAAQRLGMTPEATRAYLISQGAIISGGVSSGGASAGGNFKYTEQQVRDAATKAGRDPNAAVAVARQRKLIP